MFKMNASDELNDLAENEMKDIPRQSSGYLALLNVGRYSIGRDLRLREDDAIVFIDGETYNGDPSKFDDFLKNFENLPALLTVDRNGSIFEVFANGGLGCSYKFTNTERSDAIDEQLKEYEKRDKSGYNQYEALRNIRRDVKLNNTSYNPSATIFPIFWLISNRMWEPLLLVISTLAVSLLIHFSLFFLVYALFSLYFHKAQADIFRSYCLYQEYYFWMVFTASSEREAQKILRSFDKKCSFKYSHVGPPKI